MPRAAVVARVVAGLVVGWALLGPTGGPPALVGAPPHAGMPDPPEGGRLARLALGATHYQLWPAETAAAAAAAGETPPLAVCVHGLGTYSFVWERVAAGSFVFECPRSSVCWA
jgi:hypothetical protein